jgi:aryl-alcohol dehydrogenase-like predicted oxidoreductase
MSEMQYRRLGRSGLKVSVLSFGSWVTFANANQMETAQQAAECLSAAKDAGVNFFDNAEAYSGGESESGHGRGLQGPWLEAPRVRRLDQALLGTPRRTQYDATRSTAST